MTFKEIFREKYRRALNAARSEEVDDVKTALEELCRLFREQHDKNNGDPAYVKVSLSAWRDKFAELLEKVKINGLKDIEVRQFFGLSSTSPIDFNGLLDTEQEISVKSSVQEQVDRETSSTDKPIIPVVSTEIRQTDTDTEELPFVSENPDPKSGKTIFNDAPDTVVSVARNTENSNETTAEFVMRPESLSSFIGQEHITKPIMKEIRIAKYYGKNHIDNIMLLGNPGLGKSTLMRLIAKELGVDFVMIDCTKYSTGRKAKDNFEKFLMSIARKNEPVVLGFDEIHRLSEDLQSGLLTLLQDRVYQSAADDEGNITQIPFKEFTFIGATTNDEGILPTIKDRCKRLSFQLRDYTPEELRNIYINKVNALGLTITEEAIATCIPRSRGSVRDVDAFVKGMEVELHDDSGELVSNHIDLEIARKFFEFRGIDEIGLTTKDIEILETLNEANGPLSAGNLAARVNLAPVKYLSEIEPYLVRIKFIVVCDRGRVLTETGKNYIEGRTSENVIKPEEEVEE